MPLLIDFKSGDKVIVNGAVIENAGTSSKLLVHNQAAILRGKEILSEEETKTPAARIYFALQCAYMFADKKSDYLVLANNFLNDYVQACPSAKPLAEDVTRRVDDDQLYKALKATQKLIQHERELMENLQQEISRATGHDDSGGAT